MCLARAFRACLEGLRHGARVAREHALAALFLGDAAQALFLRTVTGSCAVECVGQLLPRFLGREGASELVMVLDLDIGLVVLELVHDGLGVVVVVSVVSMTVEPCIVLQLRLFMLALLGRGRFEGALAAEVLEHGRDARWVRFRGRVGGVGGTRGGRLVDGGVRRGRHRWRGRLGCRGVLVRLGIGGRRGVLGCRAPWRLLSLDNLLDKVRRPIEQQAIGRGRLVLVGRHGLGDHRGRHLLHRCLRALPTRSRQTRGQLVVVHERLGTGRSALFDPHLARLAALFFPLLEGRVVIGHGHIFLIVETHMLRPARLGRQRLGTHLRGRIHRVAQSKAHVGSWRRGIERLDVVVLVEHA